MLFRTLVLGLVISCVAPLCAEECLSTREDGSCGVCNFAKGFYYSGDGNCLHSHIDGCSTYDADGGCAVCEIGWTRNGCGCMRIVRGSNCKVLSGSDCWLCAEGMYPSDSGCAKVGTPINNCAYYTSETECAACATGFFLWKGICMQSLPNCLANSGPTCASCKPGYLLSSHIPFTHENFAFYLAEQQVLGQFPAGDFTCTLAISNCLEFSPVSAHICVKCENGFFVTASGNCQRITANIPFCEIYATATTCARCEPTYIPTNPTLCSPAPTGVANCRYYSSASTCMRCNNNFYLTGNTCLAVTGLIANCGLYSTATTCQWCLPTHYLSGNSCVSRPVTYTGCVRNTPTGCTMCGNNFFLASPTACVATTAVANCARFSDANTCLYCRANYYLVGNSCTAFDNVPFCQVYSSRNVCVFCAPGFYLSNSACIQTSVTIINCRFYASATTCAQCQTNFALASNALSCTMVSALNCYVFENAVKCQYCLNGYYYVEASNTCVESREVTNCARYSGVSTCIRCLPSYALTGGVCIERPVITNCDVYTPTSCQYCSNGYVWNTGSSACFMIPLNQRVPDCNFYVMSGSSPVCVECQQNFYLSGNVCMAAASGVANCDNQDSSNSCIRCLADHYNFAGLCLAVDVKVANCFLYSDERTCQLCNPNFYLSGQTCIAISGAPIENCLYHITATTCGICASGFYLAAGTNNRCVAVTASVPNCQFYNSANTCMECGANFITEPNGSCSTPIGTIGNCLYTAVSNTACTICNNGFYSLSGVCTAVTTVITGCVEYSSATTCAVCGAEFYIASPTSCQPRGFSISNCRYYANPTSCLICETGYFPSGSTCQALTSSIANCLYHASATTCFECNSSSVLTPDRKACIANCYTANNQGCTLCAVNFYLSGNACLPVTTRIPNCEIYASATVCRYCSAGYLLNPPTNECLASPIVNQANCRWGFVNACAICNTGYFNGYTLQKYSYSQCLPVPEAILGCMIYSPDGKFCEVCQTGFYQPGYHIDCELLAPKSDCYCYAGTTFSLR